MKLVKQKGKIVNVSEKEKNKKAKTEAEAESENTKVLAAKECLEKLRHTILINYNHGNLKFGMDEFDHSDCEDIKEFAECYKTIAETIEEVDIKGE